MLSLYRAVFARPGARPLALACALGWIAFTSCGLAIILAVHAATGSFGAACAAVAAFSAGSGLAAPARGRLIDRHGGGSLALFALAHALAAGALIGGLSALSAPTTALAALVAGASVAGCLVASIGGRRRLTAG